MVGDGDRTMRNIAIFSDGTGERGGQTVEENRSNIFKLYRAARPGPDSTIDALQQFAFYDAGIGTFSTGIGFFGAIWTWIHNAVSQATGLGLTKNIIDCYAQIIQHWRAGDRIFLFGFSRGAYTVRCVAAVLAHCGVPTHSKDGSPLKRDAASARAIAREAVTKIYQHVGSPRDSAYTGQREALATRFRQQYGSELDGNANAYPHFIGVFETVAAVASWDSFAVVAGIGVGIVVIVFGALALVVDHPILWTAVVVAAAILVAVGAYLKTHLKYASELPGVPFWETVHFTALHMRFYDLRLNDNVGWARHALAIDEHRADFDRVPWGMPGNWRKTGAGEPIWFEQIWFAGNHADVGGGYSEPESRLSDIALNWMANEAKSVPGGLILDTTALHISPSATGMQHDECRSLVFRYAKRLHREINPKADVHGSVAERFDLPFVLQYDVDRPYRPDGLRLHENFAGRY